VGACLLSFAAGTLTVLSPCVLPLALVAMASALQRHPLGPLALAVGFAGSSAVLGLLFALLGFGLDRDVVRASAAGLLIVLGVVLLSARLQAGVARLATPLAGRATSVLGGTARTGWPGQLVVGVLLGGIWSPCAGPTLAAAITLAAQRTSVPSAAAVMVAFSVGAALPLIALAYGSRETLGRHAAGIARVARPVAAAALIAVGALTLSGTDRTLEARLVDLMPSWLIDATTAF
jgi:cytochrome c biogenesis protein CcdA